MVREVRASERYSSSPRRSSGRQHSLSGPNSRRQSLAGNSNNGEGDSPQRQNSIRKPGNGRPLGAGGAGGGSKYSMAARDAIRHASTMNMSSINQEPIRPVLANFEQWMKLVKDNKINTTNSWNMALIDYFHDMSLLKEGDGINFQKASYTLDGCVKIYTSRVDSVATETGKLLTGLSNSRTDEFDDDNGDDGESGEGKSNDEEHGESGGEDEDGEEQKKKKKQTKIKKAETLAKSFDQLRVRRLELEGNVDPLFRKMCADFDEGGANGLLLNSLMIDSKGRYAFDGDDVNTMDAAESHKKGYDSTDSKELTESGIGGGDDDDISMVQTDEHDEGVNEETKEPEALPADIDMEFIRDTYFSDLGAIDSQMLCPSMRYVEGVARDPSGFKESLEIQEMEIPQLSHRSSMVNENNEFDNNDDPYFFDMDMGGEGETGGLGPGFEFNPNFDDNSHFSFGEPNGTLNVTTKSNVYEQGLDNITTALADDEREILAYFDENLRKNWRGPEHWKVQRLKEARGMVPLSEKKTNPVAPKPRKEPVYIDFLSEENDVDLEELFAPGGSAILMPKAQREAEESTLLPYDSHFSSIRLIKLFIKPQVTIVWDRQKKKNNDNEPEHEVEADEHFFAEQYEVPSEERQGNYDADFFGAGAGDGNDDLDSIGDDEFFDANDGYDYDKPAEQALPNSATSGMDVLKTRPNALNYARTSKKVDVRLLKNNLWKVMDMHESNRALPEDEKNEKTGEEDDRIVSKESRTFTEIVQELKHVYPKPKLADLSTSFCFICVLHLANEKGLTVTGTENYDNLSISWDPTATESQE